MAALKANWGSKDVWIKDDQFANDTTHYAQEDIGKFRSSFSILDISLHVSNAQPHNRKDVNGIKNNRFSMAQNNYKVYDTWLKGKHQLTSNIEKWRGLREPETPTSIELSYKVGR